MEWAPKPVIVAAKEDKSSIGAKITAMNTVGKVQIKFKEKMYMNPKYIAAHEGKRATQKQKTRLLQAQNSTNGTNAT